MTGQRRMDPFAVKGLLDRGRIKQAKVGRQKQEYQRQGRDVKNFLFLINKNLICMKGRFAPHVGYNAPHLTKQFVLYIYSKIRVLAVLA